MFPKKERWLLRIPRRDFPGDQATNILTSPMWGHSNAHHAQPCRWASIAKGLCCLDFQGQAGSSSWEDSYLLQKLHPGTQTPAFSLQWLWAQPWSIVCPVLPGLPWLACCSHTSNRVRSGDFSNHICEGLH